MVINNLDVVRHSVNPFKTDAPLAVNADTVLRLSIANEFLKPVGRRNQKIVEFFGVVQIDKSAQGYPLYIWRQPSRETALEDFFGLSISKGCYHCSIVAQYGNTVKSYAKILFSP